MLIFSPRYSSKLKKNQLHTQGFTLIELLVVIVILGILASIVLVSVSAAHIRARDAQRLKDMETIQGAVEQYYADNGHYPITNCSSWPNNGPAYAGYHGSWSTRLVCPTTGGTGTQSLAQALNAYIPTSFIDPSGPIDIADDRGYLYRSDDGGSYCVMIYKTPENLNNFKPSMIPPNRCSAWDSGGKCTADSGGDGNFVNAVWYGTKGPGVDWSGGC